MCKHNLSSVCVSCITVSISASTQTNTFTVIWYIEHATCIHICNNIKSYEPAHEIMVEPLLFAHIKYGSRRRV